VCCCQRTGLAAAWAFEIRQTITEVDNCNIADVLFISQIYNVLLELKLNRNTNVDAFNQAQIAQSLLLNQHLR